MAEHEHTPAPDTGLTLTLQPPAASGGRRRRQGSKSQEPIATAPHRVEPSEPLGHSGDAGSEDSTANDPHVTVVHISTHGTAADGEQSGEGGSDGRAWQSGSGSAVTRRGGQQSAPALTHIRVQSNPFDELDKALGFNTLQPPRSALQKQPQRVPSPVSVMLEPAMDPSVAAVVVVNENGAVPPRSKLYSPSVSMDLSEQDMSEISSPYRGPEQARMKAERRRPSKISEVPTASPRSTSVSASALAAEEKAGEEAKAAAAHNRAAHASVSLSGSTQYRRPSIQTTSYGGGPRSPGSPREPGSPASNPDPNDNRIRRMSFGCEENKTVDAMPALKAGAEFIVFQHGFADKSVISGDMSQSPLPAHKRRPSSAIPQPARLKLNAEKNSLWLQNGAEERIIDARLIQEVTQWTTLDEKRCLGPLARATLVITYKTADTPTRRLVLIAPDQTTQELWLEGIRLLNQLLLAGETPDRLESVVVTVPDHVMPLDYQPLIRDYYLNGPPDMLPVPSEAGAARPRSKSQDTSASPAHSRGVSSELGSPTRRGLKRINVLPLLHRGMQFLKYGRKGSPHFRHFWISDDNRTLMWLSKFKHFKKTQVPLAEVTRIVEGHNSNVFEKHNAPAELGPASFTIFYSQGSQTLDLTAVNSNAYLIWLEGLRRLVEMVKGENMHTFRKLEAIELELPLSESPTDYTAQIERHYAT